VVEIQLYAKRVKLLYFVHIQSNVIHLILVSGCLLAEGFRMVRRGVWLILKCGFLGLVMSGMGVKLGR
jgi:hypothetical protein